MTTTFALASTAVRFTVGAGVSKIVTDIIRNNTDPETTYDNVKIIAGGIVLGSMAADAATDYTDAKLEAAAAWIQSKKKSSKSSDSE